MTFQEFLRSRLESGGFTTEDTLASALPLMREVQDAHAAGAVAPLEGLDELHVEGVQIWFEEAKRLTARKNSSALRRVAAASRSAVEVVVEARRTTEIDQGEESIADLAIGDRDADVTAPVYLPGYVAWEHQLEHQDPLTDIFSLGMILASLACGLDFTDPNDLKVFVAHRKNLFAINPGKQQLAEPRGEEPVVDHVGMALSESQRVADQLLQLELL